MDVSEIISDLQRLPGYDGQIVHKQDVPCRQHHSAGLNPPLHSRIQDSLDRIGVESLYIHQAKAIDLLRKDKNVIVSTPASSGKSLCYHLPVLEAILDDKSARAIYLFPTKTLAQDQYNSLSKLITNSMRVRYATFDGDTSSQERSVIRRNTQLIISNPDMLHLGILPNHRNWYSFLKGLRYVVLDEAHVYRGVFGSHVANVIRRLRRLCLRFGSEPQFILCSATIANPGDHAEHLTGLPFEVVDEDGSPYGGKDFVFWNPPVIDKDKGNRRSSNSEASIISMELLRRNIRTMTFVRTRHLAELVHLYVRDRLRNIKSNVSEKISPYRSSYLPEDRKNIEQDLFEGRLLGLITTNAMELGIDIGSLDATISTGYPGSMSSLWQQAGRSGRSGDRSLSIFVATENPLDQYLMRHPESFFGKPYESARIAPHNPYVLRPHLLCAAYEAPLTIEDRWVFGVDTASQLQVLSQSGSLLEKNNKWYLDTGIDYPAKHVSIRSATVEQYSLVEGGTGVVLEIMGENAAFLQWYQGAVYLHKGESYLIEELDLGSRTAYAVKKEVNYYTEVKEFTEIRVINAIKTKHAIATDAYLGEVSVSMTITGFNRKKQFTDEVLGEGYINLPSRSFETIAVWFDIPNKVLDHVKDMRLDLAGGLHALEHAAISVLPLFALCDRNDIGGMATPCHIDTGKPQIFIHDGHPGGVGIAEHGFDVIEQLWTATLDIISNCPCYAGCPSCIQSPKCGNNNQPLDKQVASYLLLQMTK